MVKEDFFNKIKEIILTKKERDIANFFLEKEEQIFFMTASEIANEINVSDASVIRFIKKLGFKNYTAFRNIGQKNIKKNLDKTNDFIKKANEIKENSLEKEFIENINKDINAIFNETSLKQIKKIADIIIKKDRKFIIGFKSTAGLADFFGVRLGFMLKNISVFNIDNSLIVNSLYDIKKDDVLITFDYPMYSRVAKTAAKLAYEKGATIILFSNSKDSPVAEYANIIYKIKMNGISIFNSLILSQILIEYILTYISTVVEDKKRFSDIRKTLISKL